MLTKWNSTVSVRNKSDRVDLYLTYLIFGLVAASFFSRIWDPDFFWHLATGRWIVQNLALPDHDPFTPFVYGTDREALILKGYWLVQVSYHFLYSLFGTIGLGLLKCAVFVSLFGLVLHYHRVKLTPCFWVFLGVLPLYETLLRFRADRPNMFSLLFFSALLYLLETRRWKLLPLLMLIWANVHGGYLLGSVVIFLYLGVLALSQRREFPPLAAVWGLVAVGASFINPLGMTPSKLIFKVEESTYLQAIYEQLSPMLIALEFHEYFPGYYLALLLATLTLLFYRKSSFWPQLGVLLFTAVISLQHARYMPFFVIACAFFFPVIFSRVSLSAIWSRVMLYGAMILIVAVFIFDLVDDGGALSSGIEAGMFPEKAADFVERSGVSGRIFCSDVWGGYLIWRLPSSVILNDGRALSEEGYLINSQIKNGNGNWEGNLLALDTRIIVFSAFNPFVGKENKLWQALSFNPNWDLVYADDLSLVYFRKDVEFAGRRMSQEEKRIMSLDQALAQKRHFIEKYPKIPWHWADLGQIQVLRGATGEAVKAYRQALDLDPGNDDYRTRLKILESR